MRKIARGSHRSIRKTLHVALRTAASSYELEAKLSSYFNKSTSDDSEEEGELTARILSMLKYAFVLI